MSFDRTDYATVLQQCREALRTGNHGTVDLKKVIGCILNASGTTDGLSARAFNLDAFAAQMKTTIDAQFAILNAFTGADPAATIVAAIATASTAIATDEANMESARSAVHSINPTALSNAASTTMDG